MTIRSTDINLDYEYQVGGSLHVDAPSYVVRQADYALFNALQTGTFCYVFNARQMGKSSLRVQAMHRLKAEGTVCIALDMTRIGSEYLSPHQWYERVVSELWRGANLPGTVNLKGWLDEHPHLSLAQLLDRFIAEVLLVQISHKIVIFIDEIDSLLGLDFSVNDFFALIRACYNQRVDEPAYQRLTFCLFGVVTPSNLIQDKTRTPFNIGKAIALQGFQFSEAKSLAQGLVGYVQDLKTAFPQILEWTRGQPFLTQKVCQLVVETANIHHQTLETSTIKQLVHHHIIENWESQDEPEHLKTIRDRILRNEKQASQLLGLYQHILETSAVIANGEEGHRELRLSGLVVKRGKCLAVHNPIYAAVFNQDWVKATLDQLRPYAEAYNAWLTSGGQDESRLLRGQALEEALQWAAGRQLSSRDAKFLRASQQLENQETKQANEVLSQANRKAKRRIFLGTAVLSVTLLLTGGIGLLAAHTIQQQRLTTQLEEASNNALVEFEFDQTQALIEALQTAHELEEASRCWLSWRPIVAPLTVRECLIPKLWRNTAATISYPTSLPIRNLQTILDKIDRRHYGMYGSTAIEFTTEGERILDFSGKIRILDFQGNQLASFKQEGFRSTRYVRLSPNGQHVLIVGNRKDDYTDFNTVQLIDLQGEQLAWIETDENGEVGQAEINVLQFSPDSQSFIIGTNYGKATLWDLQGNLLALLGEGQGPIFSAQFSPDGKFILIRRGNSTGTWNHETAQLWDKQGNQIADFREEPNNWVIAAQLSPNGEVIATGYQDGTVSLWNLEGERLKIFQAHPSDIESLAFSPDSQQLLTGGDTTVGIWDIQGNLVKRFETSGKVLSAQFNPNGSQIAVGISKGSSSSTDLDKDGAIEVLDLEGNLLTIFERVPLPNAVEFSSDGQTISGALGHEIGSISTTKRIIFHLSDKLLSPISQTHTVNHLIFHPEEQHIATVHETGAAYLWDHHGRRLATLRENENLNFYTRYNPVRFSFKGDRLFVNDRPNSGEYNIQIRDLKGQILATIPDSWDSNWFNPISPDGQHIVTLGDGNTLQIWDDQGSLVGETPQIAGSVWALDFSPQGDQFLSAGGYGKVQLWNLQGEELATIEAHPNWVNAAYFINGGTQILIFSDQMQLWDIIPPATSTSVVEVNVFLEAKRFWLGSNELTSHNVIFDPQSEQLAWTGAFEADFVYLQDIEGEKHSLLQGNKNWFQGDIEYNPYGVQFNQSGDRIATLGQDGYVRVWDDAGNHIAEYEGYNMALSEDGNEIVVVSRDNHIPQVKQVDDLDSLLQRGCDWLRPYLVINRNTMDSQICEHR